MYQRLAMGSPPALSATNAEHEGDDNADDLIRNRNRTDAIATMTKTMMVVIGVSRRVGQVTLWVSARTSCRNLNGLNLAMMLTVYGRFHT